MSLSVCLPVCLAYLPVFLLSKTFLASFSFISVESAATKSHKQEFVAIQMATNCQCHRAVSTQASFVCVLLLLLLLFCIYSIFLRPVSIKTYADKLTTFEQSEILDYPDVWYLGLEAKKIEGVPGAPQNNGMT